LDVGCHIGFLPTYLSEQCSVVATGLDVADEAIAEAKKLDIGGKVEFVADSIDSFGNGRTWDMVSVIDLIHPSEPGFARTIQAVSRFVRPGGHLLVIGNELGELTVRGFFHDLGFSCLAMQLTGGFQQGHDPMLDWSSKVAVHLVNKPNVDAFDYHDWEDQSDFAEYANRGKWPNRELNRSFFLARLLEIQPTTSRTTTTAHKPTPINRPETAHNATSVDSTKIVDVVPLIGMNEAYRCPTPDKLPALRKGLRQRKLPVFHAGMGGNNSKIGSFRFLMVDGSISVEWRLVGQNLRTANFQDLCTQAALELDRLEVGWLISCIYNHHAQQIADSIGGPNEAWRESAGPRRIADSWRHWALVPAGKMSGLRPT
jgi:SAM-dependent methyltransferase